VAEAIHLDKLRSLRQANGADVATKVIPPSTHYLRFERPPVAEPVGPVVLQSGERLEGSVKYYDYGAVGIELILPFDKDWPELVREASRLFEAPELENRATELLRTSLKRIAPTLIKPSESWLREDYFVIHLQEIKDADGRIMPASELLASHSREIAQLIRGEAVSLSKEEEQEILRTNISYSQTDLLVVAWGGALIYGSGDGVEITMQLLEYANTQLLELRYYDSLMTNLLNDVYRSLERKAGPFSAWRLSRETAHVNTIRLDVMELTEKMDNAVKFLSDSYYARLYGVIASKVGVPDYRRLVDQKLRTAGELYRSLVDQFNQSRSFVLELTVVIILILELAFLFRGK